MATLIPIQKLQPPNQIELNLNYARKCSIQDFEAPTAAAKEEKAGKYIFPLLPPPINVIFSPPGSWCLSLHYSIPNEQANVA